MNTTADDPHTELEVAVIFTDEVRFGFTVMAIVLLVAVEVVTHPAFDVITRLTTSVLDNVELV